MYWASIFVIGIDCSRQEDKILLIRNADRAEEPAKIFMLRVLFLSQNRKKIEQHYKIN